MDYTSFAPGPAAYHQTPTSLPELPAPRKAFNKKFSALLIGALVIIVIVCFGAWWWNASLIVVEGKTLDNINGFPQNDGSHKVAYEWYEPVPEFIEGDELSVIFEGESTSVSNCIYKYDPASKPIFFCEALWQEKFYEAPNHYANKEKVKFMKRVSLTDFLKGRRPDLLYIAGTPTPAPTPDVTEGWQTYQNEKYGFEFKYPDNAELKSYDDYGNSAKKLDPKYPIVVNINSHAIFSVSKSSITQFNAEEISKSFVSPPSKIEPILLSGEKSGFKASFDSGDVISDFYFIQFFGHAENTFQVVLSQNNPIAMEIFSTLKFVKLDPTKGWQTYRNDKYRYSIRYPATLKFYPSSPNSDPIITGQGYTLCCDAVRITSEERYVGGLWFLYPANLSEGPNLDAINRLVFEVHKPTRSSLITIDQFFNGFAKNFPNTRKDLTINGLPAMQLADSNSESREHFFTQTIIKGSEEVYVFTYFRPDLFNDVIETFEILNERVCIQVITPAKNPKTGEVKDFPTPCDVPEGWEKI